MHSWQFPLMSGVPAAAWMVLLVVLVILVVVAIRSVARLRFFGGRGESDLETLDERYLHGRVKFEEYEEAKEKQTHNQIR